MFVHQCFGSVFCFPVVVTCFVCACRPRRGPCMSHEALPGHKCNLPSFLPSTESVWRHWDSNHRPHRSKVNGTSLTTSPLVGKERKGKEAFLLLALEASWPIGEAPSPRTLGDSSEGSNLQAGESTGTCGVMANHTKSITRSLPAPKVCGDTGIRTTDHTGRRLTARV